MFNVSSSEINWSLRDYDPPVMRLATHRRRQSISLFLYVLYIHMMFVSKLQNMTLLRISDVRIQLCRRSWHADRAVYTISITWIIY